MHCGPPSQSSPPAPQLLFGENAPHCGRDGELFGVPFQKENAGSVAQSLVRTPTLFLHLP